MDTTEASHLIDLRRRGSPLRKGLLQRVQCGLKSKPAAKLEGINYGTGRVCDAHQDAVNGPLHHARGQARSGYVVDLKWRVGEPCRVSAARERYVHGTWNLLREAV